MNDDVCKGIVALLLVEDKLEDVLKNVVTMEVKRTSMEFFSLRVFLRGFFKRENLAEIIFVGVFFFLEEEKLINLEVISSMIISSKIKVALRPNHSLNELSWKICHTFSSHFFFHHFFTYPKISLKFPNFFSC